MCIIYFRGLAEKDVGRGTLATEGGFRDRHSPLPQNDVFFHSQWRVLVYSVRYLLLSVPLEVVV